MAEPLIAAIDVEGDEDGVEFAVLRQHLRLISEPRRRNESIAEREAKLLDDDQLANELEALLGVYDRQRRRLAELESPPSGGEGRTPRELTLVQWRTGPVGYWQEAELNDAAADELRTQGHEVIRARELLPSAPVEGGDGDRALQRRVTHLLSDLFDAGVNAGIDSVETGAEIVRPDEARRSGAKALITMVREHDGPAAPPVEGDGRELSARELRREVQFRSVVDRLASLVGELAPRTRRGQDIAAVVHEGLALCEPREASISEQVEAAARRMALANDDGCFEDYDRAVANADLMSRESFDEETAAGEEDRYWYRTLAEAALLAIPAAPVEPEAREEFRGCCRWTGDGTNEEFQGPWGDRDQAVARCEAWSTSSIASERWIERRTVSAPQRVPAPVETQEGDDGRA